MGEEVKKRGHLFRKYCRIVHGHLSYFFVGVILIYAISGLTMNHLKDFNPQYMISIKQYPAQGKYPHAQNFTKQQVLDLLEVVGEHDNYTKHYYPNKSSMKVFLKSGSSFNMNVETGDVVYEALKKRPFFHQLSFLHYNPSRWWTYFSDIFAVCLILICLSGLFMNKGKRGLIGIGGIEVIEVIAGIMIPILLLIFS